MTSLIPWACRSFAFSCLISSFVAAHLAAQDEPLVRLAQRPPTPTAAWDPAAVLIEQNVAGTPAGAAELLRQLASETSTQLNQWVRDLESEDFFVREAAMRNLLRLPTIPREDWQRRVKIAGPESRWRLKRILERHESDSTQIYRAVLQMLARDVSALHDDDWLTAAVLLERSDLRDDYVAFLRQHAHSRLLPKFRAAAGDERLASRLAAAVVIGRSQEALDQPVLEKLLRDANDDVAFLTAQGAAQRGDHRALPVLIRLLDSERLEIRSESATWLCGLTGQEFDFSPHAPAVERQATMARWREWLAGPGATAVIQPPQRMAVSGRGNLQGHTLIATGGLGKVSELDASGNVVWTRSMQAWSAEKLPGGNVLLASHWESRVLEVDVQGNVVWQLRGVNAIRAKPLLNGRVLIADFGGQRVVEADRRGAVVWEHSTPDQCFDAERLVSGNTIFACPNLVREVAPDGSSVRQWTIEGRINSLQVLPSGRLLTANYGQGRVVELDEQGHVTWEFKIARPSDAFRLPGGRTLITTAEQIIEIDLQGRQIRQISAAVNGGARQ